MRWRHTPPDRKWGENRVFSAKRQTACFTTQSLPNGKCSGACQGYPLFVWGDPRPPAGGPDLFAAVREKVFSPSFPPRPPIPSAFLSGKIRETRPPLPQGQAEFAWGCLSCGGIFFKVCVNSPWKKAQSPCAGPSPLILWTVERGFSPGRPARRRDSPQAAHGDDCPVQARMDAKKGVMLSHNPLIFLVGMARFERAASASRTLRSSQTEPHPVAKKNLAQRGKNCKPFFHLSIFFICGRFFSLSDELL